jgi:hypothetical protein
MSTRLNFTNRVALDPEMITAAILQSSVASTEYDIKITIDLSAVSLIGLFDVVFTYKALSETRRYVETAVSDLKLSINHSLHGMRNPFDVVAAIEVIQKDPKGIPLIKASARKIEPEIPGKQSARRSVLKTKRDPNLNVAWRLNYSEGYPILHISDKNGLYDQLALMPQFEPLILPEIARQVFNWLIFDPNPKDQIFVAAWKVIFEQLGCDQSYYDGIPVPDDENGSMEDMTPALRAEIEAKSIEISDRFTGDFDYLNRLSSSEIGEE